MSLRKLAERVRPAHVLAAGVVLRLLLMLYGEWQDANLAVKYTDVDFRVFIGAHLR